MINLNKIVKIIVVAFISIIFTAYLTDKYFERIYTKVLINNKMTIEQTQEDIEKTKFNAVLVKSDGKDMGFLANENQVKEVLDYLRDYYVKQNNIKVLKEYKIKSNITYANLKTISKIMNSKEMAEYILKNKDVNSIVFELKGITEKQESIAPAVVITWSNELIKGESKIKDEGKAGVKLVTNEYVFNNKNVISQKVLSEKIITPCRNKIIIKGSKSVEIVASTGYNFPSRGSISSDFGSRWGKMHKGIDIAAPIGTPIYAVDSGKVSFSGNEDGYGKVVKINHDKGIETVYAHCSILNAIEGQIIKKGQKIAEVGNTGRSTGPHVHFEVIVNGKVENPMKYLKN